MVRLPDIYWLFAKNYLILFLIASVVGGLISLFVWSSAASIEPYCLIMPIHGFGWVPSCY